MKKRSTRKELVRLLMRAEITLGNAKNRDVWTVGANDTLKAISSALTAELAATRDENGFATKAEGWSVVSFTAWQLIGWQHGPIRIAGGRQSYEEIQYDCERGGRCAKLMRLAIPGVLSRTIIRYVEPETRVEIMEPVTDEAKAFLRFQNLI